VRYFAFLCVFATWRETYPWATGGSRKDGKGAKDRQARPGHYPVPTRLAHAEPSLLKSHLPDGGGEAVALVIYTKPGCPYCQQARDYYNSKGITFIDRDAQTNKEFRAQMFKFSGGDPTVPCIVKDGKYVQSGWGDPLRG
jgi:glutaredoxin 3